MPGVHGGATERVLSAVVDGLDGVVGEGADDDEGHGIGPAAAGRRWGSVSSPALRAGTSAEIETSQSVDRATSAVDSDLRRWLQARGRDPGKSITSPPINDIP